MSPSPFIEKWIQACRAEARDDSGERRRVLDLAMGRGRHALPLARAGFRVFGVDINPDAVRDAVARARGEGLQVLAWCADLTRHPLPIARFDLIVVSRYLQRDLFPDLKAAAAPHGVILYETFTTAQRALGTGPTSPDHLLEPGELRRRFDDWDMRFYEETFEPEAVARLVARRRS
jgi:tellurite methyltransferase